MKYFFSLIICLLFHWGLQAQQGYDIQISIEGFEETELYLAYYFGEQQYIKDTVQIADGKFRFQGTEPLDKGIYLVVLPPDNQYFEMIVDEDQHFSLQTSGSDYVENMKVSGSNDNELFYQDIIFLQKNRKQATEIQEKIKALDKADPEVAKLQESLKVLNEKVQSQRLELMEKHPDMLYSKVLKSMRDPEVPKEIAEDRQAAFYYYRDRYLNDLDFSDDRLLRTPVMYNRVNTYIENLTYQQPDSIKKSLDYILEKSKVHPDVLQFFTIHYLHKYAKSKVMGMDAVYVHIVESVYMKGEAWWAR